MTPRPATREKRGHVTMERLARALSLEQGIPVEYAFGMVRALFNPANQSALAASHPSARGIGLESAASNPGAPLHPGAARFYREKGLFSGGAE